MSSDPAHFNLKSRIVYMANILQQLSGPNDSWLRKDADKGAVPRKITLLHNTEDHPAPQLGTESSSPPNPDTDTEIPRKFTLNGRNRSWILYGGGSRACPGRHFAKQEILITVAMLLVEFDIEILGDENVLGISKR